MRRGIGFLLAAVLQVAAACADGSETGQPSPSPSPSPDDVIRVDDFSPELFDETSHVVDNEWFPLVPGTKHVWRGTAFEDGELIRRKVVFVVTDLTKEIAGVRAIAGWDRDYNDGVLGESELIFYAQDRFGNVWHLGEYVEHWKEEKPGDKELDGSRLWVHGDPEGAKAGFGMKADPEAATGAYSMGFAPPPWFWDDRARVAETGVRTCIPLGCYDDVVVIEEFEPRFPGAFQLKYYARGVGSIRIGWRGDDEEQEEMVLTKLVPLDPVALAQVRESVLQQEHRGYAYARTEPMQPIEP